MTTSTTYTDSVTFTVTHARELAAKVATDLKRIQRLYDRPSDAYIQVYEEEVTLLLKGGHLGNVTYGFQRQDKWIEPTLTYSARELAAGSNANDDPGKIVPGAEVEGASFTSFLTYSPAFVALSATQRAEVKATLPIKRVSGNEPGVDGYYVEDRTYSAGDKALDRRVVKSRQ